MDFSSARKYCIERNWKCSLELINNAEKEIYSLKTYINELEEQVNASKNIINKSNEN